VRAGYAGNPKPQSIPRPPRSASHRSALTAARAAAAAHDRGPPQSIRCTRDQHTGHPKILQPRLPHRGAARRRRLDHAAGSWRQHERALDHDRREMRRDRAGGRPGQLRPTCHDNSLKTTQPRVQFSPIVARGTIRAIRKASGQLNVRSLGSCGSSRHRPGSACGRSSFQISRRSAGWSFYIDSRCFDLADRVAGSHDFLRLMEFYPRFIVDLLRRPERTADSGSSK
jgi:hypothetical protein